MRLKTIMTLPVASNKEKLLYLRDWSARKIARFIPLRIRYWVTIIEVSRATANNENCMTASIGEVLNDLQSPKVVR